MGEKVQALIDKHYNITSTVSNSLDPELWAGESYNVAPSAYKGATEKEKLTDDYIAANLPQLEFQLIKAGFRLAHLIAYLYSDSSTLTDTEQATNSVFENSTTTFMNDSAHTFLQ